jgi:hypothetical protein
MGAGADERVISEAEVRAVISSQLVIDSARAAGLEVASPLDSGCGGVLLVYGGEATAGRALFARRVEVRAFDSGLEETALAVPVVPGELVALVEWGSVGEGDGVLLLASSEIEDVRRGAAVLADCRATGERWRTLVLG